MLTTAGKTGIANRVSDATSVSAFNYLAIGVGTTAAALGDTTLGSEITDSGLARYQVTPTVSADTITWTHTWTATGSKTIAEGGCLNASSVGTLLFRQVLGTARAVTSGNTYTLTATQQFS